jgi:hypothetical protein
VLLGPTRVLVQCQTRGDTFSAADNVNDAWSFVPALGGYLSHLRRPPGHLASGPR